MPTKKIVQETKERMENAVEALGREFSQVRTGRASTSVLDMVKVDAYGSSMPINQVATISVPDPHMLLIQPWDKSLLGEIVKAIQRSDLGLNPQADAAVLRVPIPRLTEERRLELVKLVKKMTEDAKVSIRRARGDAIKQIQLLEKEKEIGEDMRHTVESQIQDMTEEYTEQVDDVATEKEKEIMQV